VCDSALTDAVKAKTAKAMMVAVVIVLLEGRIVAKRATVVKEP